MLAYETFGGFNTLRGSFSIYEVLFLDSFGRVSGGSKPLRFSMPGREPGEATSGKTAVLRKAGAWSVPAGAVNGKL